MSDRVLPLLVVYAFYLNPIVKVSVTYVTPDWFYLWMEFPPIGHSAILHIETTGLIDHWIFGLCFSEIILVYIDYIFGCLFILIW